MRSSYRAQALLGTRIPPLVRELQPFMSKPTSPRFPTGYVERREVFRHLGGLIRTSYWKVFTLSAPSACVWHAVVYGEDLGCLFSEDIRSSYMLTRLSAEVIVIRRQSTDAHRLLHPRLHFTVQPRRRLRRPNDSFHTISISEKGTLTTRTLFYFSADIHSPKLPSVAGIQPEMAAASTRLHSPVRPRSSEATGWTAERAPWHMPAAGQSAQARARTRASLSRSRVPYAAAPPTARGCARRKQLDGCTMPQEANTTEGRRRSATRRAEGQTPSLVHTAAESQVAARRTTQAPTSVHTRARMRQVTSREGPVRVRTRARAPLGKRRMASKRTA